VGLQAIEVRRLTTADVKGAAQKLIGDMERHLADLKTSGVDVPSKTYVGDIQYSGRILSAAEKADIQKAFVDAKFALPRITHRPGG
jgi:hypothetical protein